MQQGPCLKHCYSHYAVHYMTLGVIVGALIVAYLCVLLRQYICSRTQKNDDEKQSDCFLIPEGKDRLRILCMRQQKS